MLLQCCVKLCRPDPESTLDFLNHAGGPLAYLGKSQDTLANWIGLLAMLSWADCHPRKLHAPMVNQQGHSERLVKLRLSWPTLADAKANALGSGSRTKILLRSSPSLCQGGF